MSYSEIRALVHSAVRRVQGRFDIDLGRRALATHVNFADYANGVVLFDEQKTKELIQLHRSANTGEVTPLLDRLNDALAELRYAKTLRVAYVRTEHKEPLFVLTRVTRM